MEKTNIFKCKPQEVHFTITNRVPYNKLLTNLACSSRTGKYWPSVVFVRTSLRSVRTTTTSGQYSPVRPSRSVSKTLIKSCDFCVGRIHQSQSLTQRESSFTPWKEKMMFQWQALLSLSPLLHRNTLHRL